MNIENIKLTIKNKRHLIDKIYKKISECQTEATEEFFARSNAEWFVDTREAKKYKTIEDIARLKWEHAKEQDPKSTLDNVLEEVKDQFNIYAERYEFKLARLSNELSGAIFDLEKYESMLTDFESRSKLEKIKVIADFLEDWKKTAKEYITKNFEWYLEYLEMDKIVVDFESFGRLPGGKVIKRNKKSLKQSPEYSKKLKELVEEQRKLLVVLNPLTKACMRTALTNPVLSDQEVEKKLDIEVEQKYQSMIDKITKFTGNITDVSNLKINSEGNLEGIVVGDDGKCKLKTVQIGTKKIESRADISTDPIAQYRITCSRVK